MITGSQLRMARAGLRLGIRDVARLADVAPNTISRIESDHSANSATLRAIQSALEAAGVEFTNGDAPGVRLPQRAARS